MRARRGEFDGVVAMYHDQGHIALKLLGVAHAVNITAGLPLVRTSVAHGTAYDIAGQGKADAGGMIEAAHRCPASERGNGERPALAGWLGKPSPTELSTSRLRPAVRQIKP